MASFATEVKDELARLIYANSCCRASELAALLRMGGQVIAGTQREPGITFTAGNAAVARKVLTLVKREMADIPTEVMVRRGKKLRKRNSYTIRIAPSPQAGSLFSRLGILRGEDLTLGTDMTKLRRSCCRAAYLRGAFLGGGSVNRPEANYHLELVTEDHSLAEVLLTLLRRMDFPAGMTERKDGYVVYMKEGDGVIDFLGMLQADKAVEKFEVARNLKEVRNQVNRLVNCETANLQKAVDAAWRQIEDIRLLMGEGRMQELSLDLRETAKARLANPEASLAELSEILCISKSGLSHRLRKIGGIAAGLRGEGQG